MAVLSIPLNTELEEAIQNLLDWGIASNRADAGRKAILQLAEEAAINEVLKAEQEVAENKIIRGNLKDFLAN